MTERPYAAALALALVCFPAGHAFAQDLSVGIRAGVSVSDFASDEVDYGTRGGFSFAGVVEYGLASWLAVLPEFQFVMKGSSTDVQIQTPGADPAQLTTTSLDVDINYFELLLPVAVRLPLKGGAIAPRVFVGPTLGLKLSCTFSSQVGGLAFRSSCESELPEGSGTPLLDSHTLDLGVAIGGGLAVSAGPGSVTADVRFIRGLTRVDSDDDATPNIENRVLQFLLGYVIALNG